MPKLIDFNDERKGIMVLLKKVVKSSKYMYRKQD